MIIVFAGCSAAYSYTGEAGPPMLKMVFGSRALSLGGAFVAVSDDVYYIDSNPAGGNTRKIYQISLLHQEWIEDANYEAIRISRGFAERFFVGIGFTYFYLPFTYYNFYGEKTGNNSTISQALGVLNFGYSLKKHDISFGTNFKVFYNHIPDELLRAAYGNDYEDQDYLVYASDIGFMVRTDLLKRYIGPEPSLTFGGTVKNLGYSEAIDKLPVEFHAGISYRPFRSLLLSTEFVYPLYEPIYGAAGMEFDILKRFFLQGGIQIKESPMFAAGIGFKRKDVELNVSYTPSLVFKNMISISLNFFFGETEENIREKKVEAYLIVALEFFKESRYEEALEQVNKVLDIDPKNRRASALKDAIEEKITLKKNTEKYN
jgi:hypothetical protein